MRAVVGAGSHPPRTPPRRPPRATASALQRHRRGHSVNHKSSVSTRAHLLTLLLLDFEYSQFIFGSYNATPAHLRLLSTREHLWVFTILDGNYIEIYKISFVLKKSSMQSSPEWKVEREGTFLGKTSWFGNSRLAALAAEPVPVLAPVTVNCVFKL